MRTIAHVARRFSVSTKTVLRWVDAGELTPLDLTPAVDKSKKRLLRFYDDDLDRLEERRLRRAAIAEAAREKTSSR
jgi:transposase